MTSPYLDHSRPTRKIVEELIIAREAELTKTISAAERRRLERDLAFLREELARIDGQGAVFSRRGPTQTEAALTVNPGGNPMEMDRLTLFGSVAVMAMLVAVGAPTPNADLTTANHTPFRGAFSLV
jgi:hypothetical protein